MKSEKKYLKTKINPNSERNKLGQKTISKKNNSIYGMVNNDINYDYNLLSRNNLLNNNYKTSEYSIENVLEDYPLKMDNVIQNLPFFTSIQQKSKFNLNHYNSSSKIDQINDGQNTFNRLNTDNNDSVVKSRAQKIKVRERLSIDRGVSKNNNFNNNYMNENNEKEQKYKVFRNNLREKKTEPFTSKINNYMKDNLTEIKYNFQMKDTIDKEGRKNIITTQKKKEITLNSFNKV